MTRVWLARAAVEPSAAQSELLTPAERTVVSAKRQPLDGYRSATARVLLKLLLAQEFGIDPLSVSLLSPAGHGGKPVLRYAPTPGLDRPLRTNVSHAGGQVIVALTQGESVGVDVEEHRATDFSGFDDIALSERERSVVASLPEPRRAQQRAEFWVRKEAVLKALGVGLRQNPAKLCFAGAAAHSTAQLPGHPPVAVQLLHAPPNYSAAVCVNGAEPLSCHESSFSAAEITNYATKTCPIRK
ncbi:4'-phosphopantetheinyl transferase family protein [Arthrobacter sp. TMN-49]